MNPQNLAPSTSITSNVEFSKRRRQPFLDVVSYEATLKCFDSDFEFLDDKLLNAKRPEERASALSSRAYRHWFTFQLKLTAGDSLDGLAQYLALVVESFEAWVDALDAVPENEYDPPFVLNDVIDTYIDYLNLLSAAVLLHREDLIPRISALNAGTEYEKSDAVIEDLLGFYLPDRPALDGWYWKQYTPLLNAIDQEFPIERSKAMAKYVRGWYKSMKGVAHFWGKHEKVKPEFSEYFGYWAMCSAAFSYLYDIDDSKYRDEMVYPNDLIDYARSMPRKPVRMDDGSEILRVLGGQACPTAGQWFSPAKADSARHFKKGDVMPVFESEYGLTLWQLTKPDAAPSQLSAR